MRQETPIESVGEFESLLERARHGKSEALDQLFKDCWKTLEPFCRSLCPRSLARRFDHLDAVQETLLSAARDFRQFRGTTKKQLESWLKAIARSEIANLCRKQLAQERDARLDVSVDQPKARSSLVQDSWINASPNLRRVRYRRKSKLFADWGPGAETDDTLRRYLAAWNAIGELYQWSIFWKRVEKCSYAQLACNMHMTPDALRKQYNQASRALRVELKKQGLR
jgi:RNA polymerase sigma factor (sigma-70 family)